MKKCPKCQKVFEDNMRFCQADGTPLVELAAGAAEKPAPPPDPFKTVVAGSRARIDDDVLQLPDRPDPLKTVAGGPKGATPSEPASSVPEPPKFSEPSLSPPSFGDLGPSTPAPKVELTPAEKMPPAESGLPKPIQPPSSSPFDQPRVETPKSSPFDQAKPTPVAPPLPPPIESSFGTPPSPFEKSPFSQPNEPLSSPFSPPEPQANLPFQQAEWTPPPAPIAAWQDQGLGANTPFQPPMASGPNQTMAVVALVLGILSIVCCQLTGPVAIVVGYMAKNKADINPNEFGGRGLALAGMITGIVGTVLLVLVAIYYIVIIGLFATGTIR